MFNLITFPFSSNGIVSNSPVLNNAYVKGFVKGNVLHWYDTPIVSLSYTKPNVATLTTLGIEMCKVPQTAALIRVGNGTVTNNGDGTYQWVSSTKNQLVKSDFATSYLLQSALTIGIKYRINISFEVISGSVSVYFASGGRFKETKKYSAAGLYTYSEILEVSGINPTLYFLNYAATGVTTEIKVVSISAQELSPQVSAFADTNWIPESNSDWSISMIMNIVDSPSDFLYNGLLDETTNKHIILGQDNIQNGFNIKAGVCGDQSYQYIDSGVLSRGRHHAIVSFNSATKAVDLYVGGKLIGSQTSIYATKSARDFLLGHTNAYSAPVNEAPIDSFKVFDRAVTLAEANELVSTNGFIRLAMVGDSTYTSSLGWWKGLFQYMPNQDNLMTLDTAKGGATAKSFYDEGWFAKVLLTKPKYVFIGFGQNDKTYGVDIEAEFKPYINLMLDELIATGVTPYLCTPGIGHTSGVPNTSNAPYAQAIRDVGSARGILVIDIYQKEYDYFISIGATATATLYTDSVHLNLNGAYAISNLIRQELDRLGITLL